MDTQDQFTQLQGELRPFLVMLSQAADAILDQDVSSYPIFVVHRTELGIGLPLVEQAEDADQWSINASTLEELVTRQLIQESKVPGFRNVYKNPRKFLCLLVLQEDGASFVFMPR